MRIIAFMFLCPSLLWADDIYLKTNSILMNVQITDSTSEMLYAKSKERDRAIPRSNILYYRFSPFNLSQASWYETYDPSKLGEIAQRDSITAQKDRDSISAAAATAKTIQEKNQDKLTVIKTVTGETITGEFLSSTDSTVTYKTSYGAITIEKRMILSADKPRSQTSTEEKEPRIDGLTAEQRKVFTRNRLTIELEGVGVSSNDVYFRTSLYSSWRKWNAFEGFRPLTEEEFFNKTGYPKEAQQAHEYRNSLTQMTTFGAILAVGGTVLLYAGYTHTNQETLPYSGGTIDVPDPNTTQITIGYLSSTIGSTLIIASAIGASKNSAPYSTVEGIADEYNKKLVERIKNGELIQ